MLQLLHEIENVLKADFSDVRIYQNSQIAYKINALAYTCGNEIHFAPECCNSWDKEGKKILVHELIHIIQQRQFRVRPNLKVGNLFMNNCSELEEEADSVSEYIVSSNSASPLGIPSHLLGSIPNSTYLSSNVIQCVVSVNIDGKSIPVLPEDYEKFERLCLEKTMGLGITWNEKLSYALKYWLTTKNHIYEVKDLDALVKGLCTFTITGKAGPGVSKIKIRKEEKKTGHTRRQRERFARLMEPCTVQTPREVPGMADIPDEELIRLSPIGEDEKCYWLRACGREILMTVKARGTAECDEPRIIAAGDPEDPSYTVTDKDGRSLGCRYKALPEKDKVPEQDRMLLGIKSRMKLKRGECTYGSQRDREGTTTFGSHITRGHLIPLADTQVILAPFQGECKHWQTRRKIIDANRNVIVEETYPDYIYLPESSEDKSKFTERHPYNMYLENKSQGEKFRRARREKLAQKNSSSFIQVQEYGGQDVTPETPRSAEYHVLYPMPDKVHYWSENRPRGNDIDNRPRADFSNVSGYEPVEHRHPLEQDDSVRPSLGNYSTAGQDELTTNSNELIVPFAEVLDFDSTHFKFNPSWEDNPSIRYISPPPSPCNIPIFVETEPEEGSMSIQAFQKDGKILEEVCERDGIITKKWTKIRRFTSELWNRLSARGEGDSTTDISQEITSFSCTSSSCNVDRHIEEFKKRGEELLDELPCTSIIYTSLKDLIKICGDIEDYDKEACIRGLVNLEDFECLLERLEDLYHVIVTTIQDREEALDKAEEFMKSELPCDDAQLKKMEDESKIHEEAIYRDGSETKNVQFECLRSEMSTDTTRSTQPQKIARLIEMDKLIKSGTSDIKREEMSKFSQADVELLLSRRGKREFRRLSQCAAAPISPSLVKPTVKPTDDKQPKGLGK